MLNIYDVLKEENIGRKYNIISNKYNEEVTVSKDSNGMLFLKTNGNEDILNIMPGEEIMYADFKAKKEDKISICA